MTKDSKVVSNDGLIPSIFKKYYTGGFEVDIDDNTVNVIPHSTLEDAFRELIEGIKQLADIDNVVCVDLCKLIGETEQSKEKSS